MSFCLPVYIVPSTCTVLGLAALHRISINSESLFKLYKVDVDTLPCTN